MPEEESGQSRFSALFRELQERYAEDPDGLVLLHKLFSAFSDSITEAGTEAVDYTLANLVLGVRDEASSPEVSEWRGTVELDIDHFRCRHDDREKMREYVQREAAKDPSKPGSENLRTSIDESLRVAEELGGEAGHDLREDALVWEPLAAPTDMAS